MKTLLPEPFTFAFSGYFVFSQVKTKQIAKKNQALCCMDFHHFANSGKL
jgi:hypothetical protein